MTKFRPFTQPRKARQAHKQARQAASEALAPAAMTKLTSGAWKQARDVKRLRLPSGS